MELANYARNRLAITETGGIAPLVSLLACDNPKAREHAEPTLTLTVALTLTHRSPNRNPGPGTGTGPGPGPGPGPTPRRESTHRGCACPPLD